ncbi:MAG: NUDIX domain-containing protein [Candidatus Magasanikbacteria bacterium]
MQELTKQLEQTPIIYVTRDIERALGLENTPNYYIISNYNESFNPVLSLPKEGVDNDNILLIKEEKQLDTWELLQHPETKKFLRSVPSPLQPAGRQAGEEGQGEVNIVVFKPTKQIERICAENNWNLLNPLAELSNKIEEKISQLDWLGDLKKYLPDYSVKLCKDIEWKENKFILQFNRSHTGSGTMLIGSAEQLDEIKNKFPEREARLAKYIEGPLFTNNNVVTKNETLIGNINYQITGLQPFTDLPFATIGNDWGFPHKYLSEEQIEQYKKIVTDIGDKLREDSWRGLFGVDIVVEESTGKLYLVEINARQPASTTFESQLQKTTDSYQPTAISTFEAHLASLLNLDLSDYELIEIENGAQIIQRVTKDIPSLPEPKYNKRPDMNVIKYNNTKPGSDLLRIQTHYSLIDGHNKLSKNGLKIIDFITVTKKGNAWNLPRGAILAIKDNKILLIERQAYTQHFFTPPGGTKEDSDKDILETAKREGKEETNLNFDIPEQKPLYFNVNGRDEYYFFVENISGELKLGKEEYERSNENNSFKLVWVDLKELPNIMLLPQGITEKILEKIS